MSTLFRAKCPSCGSVHNVAATCACPKCKNELTLSQEGVVQLYRMGSPIGVAAGYGIYINGQPYGHIGNKESFRIPLPYGKYTFHMTCGATRKCQDLTVELTPENPAAYIKAWIKPGFWTNCIMIETAAPSEMPPL